MSSNTDTTATGGTGNPFQIHLQKGGEPRIVSRDPEYIAAALALFYPSSSVASSTPLENVAVEDLTSNEPNKGSRRASRHAAMQFLYAWDLARPEPRQLFEFTRRFFEALEFPRETYAFGEELAIGTIENIDEVDGVIRRRANNWSLERVAKVDLSILRLGVHEILHRPDIPPIVTINEAIEMSKRFSSADARRFINGVLDRLLEESGRNPREAIA